MAQVWWVLPPILRLIDTRQFLGGLAGVEPLSVSSRRDVVRGIADAAPHLDLLAIVGKRGSGIEETAKAGGRVDVGREIGWGGTALAESNAGVVRRIGHYLR